ncbi:Uncharacterised protein [Vibrio cholerae]|nr:Uncharacterised protein [Vibrio cholerae]
MVSDALSDKRQTSFLPLQVVHQTNVLSGING